MFPKIHQHIDFPTRGKITWTLFTPPREELTRPYQSPTTEPRSLGASDHITVMLMPAYRDRSLKPSNQYTNRYKCGLKGRQRHFFDTTDWDMFKQAATYNNTTDLQEHSETVTVYITKCIDDVMVTKTITVRANQKPWLTGEVYRLLKARNVAFRAGDEEGLKTARANLSHGLGHSEPVAGDSDHYGLKAPTTDL